jgi:hypothetical protein
MSEEDVRRLAVEAARDRNADDLWWLTEAHLEALGAFVVPCTQCGVMNTRGFRGDGHRASAITKPDQYAHCRSCGQYISAQKEPNL